LEAGLETTYDVHLGLIGNRVVDFLLVLIELYSLGVTAEALRANIEYSEYFQIIFRPIKTFIIISLDPVPYYIYPALALLLVLNLLNLKPVSYGIPYQKDIEKSRTLILLKLNCPFT